jgi:stage II sporulation protein D
MKHILSSWIVMITKEPKIKVAICQNYSETEIILNGSFRESCGLTLRGKIAAKTEAALIRLSTSGAVEIAPQKEFIFTAEPGATFTVKNVSIGIDFHWQRLQEQSFTGDIILRANADSTFNLINVIPLEAYLASVISSEMSATAPLEFLKAQAITARSWLVAMLERKKQNPAAAKTELISDNEIVRWFDINDHAFFDVCADDHCQRYQGITRVISPEVNKAISATRGIFLLNGQEICDARYHKACGGRTEIYSTAWEDKSPPYLQSTADSPYPNLSLKAVEEADGLLPEDPHAYCNIHDKKILSQILPSFDQETPDFYRWQVTYKRDELEEIIQKKSGIDLGDLEKLEPLERGPSGRISKLKIEGSKRSLIIGKELEIRRWLSPSHLLSSAFVVETRDGVNGLPEKLILHGGGWGHGVGLCQIGAAVMAAKGFNAEEIIAHYFRGAKLQKLY